MLSGKIIGQFRLEKELGRGSFGCVYSCRNVNDNSLHAIKIIEYQSLQNSDGIVGQLLKDEIKVLSEIDSPNVLKLEYYYQSRANCYIVMEYCDSGDLEKYWEKQGRILPEEKVVDIIRQLLNGLHELHKHCVIHRDLKLANILIHQDQIKLADLGFCQKLANKDMLVELCLGSPGTMAPEVASFQSYGLQSDIFSIGCMFYQLLFGDLPFDYQNSGIYLIQVKQQKINFQRNGIRVSKEIEEIITLMLKDDPKQRLTFNQLYKYNLFKQQSKIMLKQKTSVHTTEVQDQTKQFYEKIYQTQKDVQITQQQFDCLKTEVDVMKTQGKQSDPMDVVLFINQQPKFNNNNPINIGDSYSNALNQFSRQLKMANNIQPMVQMSPLQTITEGSKIQEKQIQFIQPTNNQNLMNNMEIEMKINEFKKKWMALQYCLRNLSEIEEIKPENTEYFNMLKFIFYKQIVVKSRECLEQLQYQSFQIPQLQEYQQKFYEQNRIQQFYFYLQQITNNQTLKFKQEYIQELSEQPTNEFNYTYIQALIELHKIIKLMANIVMDNKIKKNFIIVLLHLQKCQNFEELSNLEINMQEEFEEIKKQKIIDLMYKIKMN